MQEFFDLNRALNESIASSHDYIEVPSEDSVELVRVEGPSFVEIAETQSLELPEIENLCSERSLGSQISETALAQVLSSQESPRLGSKRPRTSSESNYSYYKRPKSD